MDQHQDPEWADAIIADDVEAVRALIERGVFSVNQKQQGDPWASTVTWTPLARALFTDSDKVVRSCTFALSGGDGITGCLAAGRPLVAGDEGEPQ
jgi:hypothetical protein